MNDFLTFIRIEQRRSNVMTSARSEFFCRKHNINIGYYDGYRISPRNFTERSIALKIHNNHFCLVWKPQKSSFNQVIEKELKPNFKVVHNVISDKHVKSFIKYEYKPEKVQSQSTDVIVFDLKTFNTDKDVTYANCIYRLGKTLGNYNRDITQKEYEKCRKDCNVFKGTDGINEIVDYILQFKGEPKKVNNRNVR